MGLFDNAKTVMIGNKEVQSIKVTSNNAVLYEKQAQDNYLLTLTSNKDILSYYDNESATLTATLTNNNVPVSGEKVVFSFPRDENYTSKSITANTETTVGRKYIINTTFPENYRSTTYLDSEHKVAIVTSASDGAALYIDGEQRSNDFTTNFSVDEGILTCSSGTFDCTSYDMSVIKSTINLNISDYGGHVRSTTDSNGECSVSYNSKGTGDINIKAKCMNLQETYVIEDCLLYDDATTNKLSNYSYIDLDSFTHQTDHYEAVRIIDGYYNDVQYYSPIYNELILPENFEIRCDLNTDNVTDSQTMLTLSQNHPITYRGVSEMGIVSTNVRYGLFKRVNGTFTSYTTLGNLNPNIYYTFIVIKNGTSVTGKIINNQGTIIHNTTQEISEVSSYNKWNIICGYRPNTLKFKNLKIKSL